MQIFRTTVVIYVKFFLPPLALVAQLNAHPTGSAIFFRGDLIMKYFLQ